MAEYRGTNYFGDRPMSISGRLVHERERLTGMTADEREWREKWCKDQELAPDEPRFVPEMEKVMMNPLQRLYKVPLHYIFYTKLQPVIGPHAAHMLRHIIPKSFLIYGGILSLWYYFKYHEGTWEYNRGWQHRWGKPALLPGDPGFPNRYEHKPQDFANRAFPERTAFLNMAIDGTSCQTTKG